jgi:AcrR family transcriptional regulator
MNYQAFRKTAETTLQEIAGEVFRKNQESIRVKKETTAVRNLSKIVAAVFTISGAKGFQAMTMRDLSAETGMSLGALYGYFSSKEELLSIIQSQGRSLVRRVLEACVLESESPLEQLRAVIRAHLFLSEAARPWFFFTFMEARNLNPDELRKVMEMESYTETILVRILEAGEAAGVFCPGEHLLTASVIKAMQQDWYLKRWKYSRRGVTIDQYTAHVLGFVERFCLTRPLTEPDRPAGGRTPEALADTTLGPEIHTTVAAGTDSRRSAPKTAGSRKAARLTPDGGAPEQG